ncbi:hypothetical protein ABIF65_003810 [Bradyrhizobium japonicum]
MPVLMSVLMHGTSVPRVVKSTRESRSSRPPKRGGVVVPLSIQLNVRIEKPAIRAKAGLVRLFASEGLVGANEKPRQNFLDNETGKIRPVGHVWYRGDSYQAVLSFPGDMLGPALTMLSANKYRYVILVADQGGGETHVHGFTLAEFHGDEPDLAASWDDV